jgi:hypothetical protein
LTVETTQTARLLDPSPRSAPSAARTTLAADVLKTSAIIWIGGDESNQ